MEEVIYDSAYFRNLLETKNYFKIKNTINHLEATDIAAIFEDFSPTEIVVLFRLLNKELAAEVFVELDSDQTEALIKAFSDSELKKVIDELYVDDMADIIEELPANVVSRILQQTDSLTRRTINEILKYPDDSAASIMNTDYLNLNKNMTAREARDRIRKAADEIENFYTFYVTDDVRKLIGFVSIKKLLMANEDDKISDIMDPDVVYAKTTDDKEEVANMLSRYDFVVLPVIDSENRMVGIVTVDDAMDVLEEEVTEDIEKISAILPSEKPYLKTSVFDTFKQRIPWLLLLMVSATFTSKIISSFESALATQVALVAFIPMLMDTGGNCGSQASVTIIRGMSLGEIELEDIIKVLWKELRVAIFCGGVLATATFFKILLVDGMLMHTAGITFKVTFVVCLTMFIAVVLAKLVGCTLPIIAKTLKLDPAVMASPFITTIVDALTLLVYFNVAQTLLTM
jgi:magnesium transporter